MLSWGLSWADSWGHSWIHSWGHLWVEVRFRLFCASSIWTSETLSRSGGGAATRASVALDFDTELIPLFALEAFYHSTSRAAMTKIQIGQTPESVGRSAGKGFFGVTERGGTVLRTSQHFSALS